MNALNKLLMDMGVHDTAERAMLQREIESCGVEIAIAKLVTDKLVNDDELKTIAQVYEGGKLEQEAFEALFNTEQRQQILEHSLTEAIKITVEAAQVRIS